MDKAKVVKVNGQIIQAKGRPAAIMVVKAAVRYGKCLRVLHDSDVYRAIKAEGVALQNGIVTGHYHGQRWVIQFVKMAGESNE